MDLNLDDIANLFATTLGKVDHSVVLSPPLPVLGIQTAGSIDEHLKTPADEFVVELTRNLIGSGKETLESGALDGVADLRLVLCRRCPGSR